MKKSLKIYEFPTIIEKDSGGYYFAYVPSMQGCYTQGKTLEEAFRNIREVIELHIEDSIKGIKGVAFYRHEIATTSA